MHTRELNSNLAPQPASSYSQAVEVTGATRILHVSGQIGTEIDGTAPPSMTEQARLAWRNLAAQLAAADMSFDNLVKVTQYIADIGEIGESRVARAEALGDRRPASTVVSCALANPAWKIEIEAIAYAAPR